MHRSRLDKDHPVSKALSQPSEGAMDRRRLTSRHAVIAGIAAVALIASFFIGRASGGSGTTKVVHSRGTQAKVVAVTVSSPSIAANVTGGSIASLVAPPAPAPSAPSSSGSTPPASSGGSSGGSGGSGGATSGGNG
jgi:uncharacterized membrane protein YgcG